MESSPGTSPYNFQPQAAHHTAKTLQTDPPTAASMFKAEKIRISGGSFNVTTNTTVNGPSSLDRLYKRAAPNAILNAGGRADEVRCHPGTREEVIGLVEKWRDAQDDQTPPIFWLSGPAGAGKSAIMQTIAERCNEEEIPQANFFFFRTDISRNSLSPLIATLVHQIILLYPSVRDLVAAVLCRNPLILDAVLEDQLVELIVTPLQAIQQSSSSYIPPLLLIDGLDECDSEEKRSQRQILAAFDKVLTKHPFLVRLLVASRDESQIQATFNNLSSHLLPIYLDDQYQPEKDIRAFVVDAFEQVQKTHPLAHTLPEAWPFDEDVEKIVWKSSGQFIYPATIMRFIFMSSATPVLSLARVQGAADISLSSKSKSPFFHLDTIYTYILSQVDNQELLKNIFHSQLFIMNMEPIMHDPPSLQALLLRISSNYTRSMVDSCLADITPIAQCTDNQLFFHHASFTDYLFDLSRSGAYFVDLHVFNFRIQPCLWNNLPSVNGYELQDIHLLAWWGICRLSQLPHGFLDIILALPDMAFTGNKYKTAIRIFKHLHLLCNHEDDMTKYKQIVFQWAKATVLKYEFPLIDEGFRHEDWPPDIARYMAMVIVGASGNIRALSTYADQDWYQLQLSDIIPKEVTDIPEVAAWLTTVLHCAYLKKKYATNIQEYNQLMREWMSWVAQNGIPLDNVDDVPNAKWYHAMATIERDVMNDIVLRREPDCNVTETAVWLTALLHHIHEEKYHTSIQEYNQLMRRWIFWAIENSIPLNGLDGLPNTRWYHAMANIERDLMSDTALHREEDCDVIETASWLTSVLHQIHGKKYSGSVQEYNQLVRKWAIWAAQNDIPLDGVDDLPNVCWYHAMANIERNVSVDIVLHRERDCDVPQTAVWLIGLLHRIHKEKYRANIQEYNQLVRKWTFWAIQNDIPLNGLDGLPNTRWYRAMANIERDFTSDIALHREHDCDMIETAVWLTALLHRIHGEKYRSNIQEYNQLVQKWMFWAIQNDIPVEELDDLPNTQWYRAMANIERDVAVDIALHREDDCDVDETAVWLRTLLHRIHQEKYSTSIEEYSRLLRKWTSWAVRNDISLGGVENLPKARWFLVCARLEKWVACYLRPSSNEGRQFVLYLVSMIGLIAALLALYMLR